MKIYTIGFTGKTAEEFFGLLNSADAQCLVDTRLNNKSQLSGFTKKGNIEFFVERLTGMRYIEAPLLMPEAAMLKEYRNGGDWDAYEEQYNRLLEQRDVGCAIDAGIFSKGVVLLCSERTPEKCHRRLAADYLKANLFPQADISHL